MSAVKITKTYADFASAVATVTIDSGYSLPANAAVTGIAVTKNGFALEGATFMQLLVGTESNNIEFAQLDVLSSDPAVQDELLLESRTEDTPIRLQLIADPSLSLSDMTSGDITIDIIFEALPS